MADKVEEKIDEFLDKKGITISTEDQGDYDTLTAVKKLMQCDWVNGEDHLRDIAIDCFGTLLMKKDDIANKFWSKVQDYIRQVGDEIIGSEAQE